MGFVCDKIDFTAFKTNKYVPAPMYNNTNKPHSKKLESYRIIEIFRVKSLLLTHFPKNGMCPYLRRNFLKSHNYGFEEGSQYGGLLHTADFKSTGPGISTPGFTTAWMANSTIFVLIYVTFS